MNESEEKTCPTCGKTRYGGPKVSVTLLGAPAAAALVLPSPFLRLVELVREGHERVCVCKTTKETA